MGLLPQDIEDLGPYELALVLEGRRQREEERIRLTAWQVATMINLWSNDKVSVHQLVTGESEEILDIDEEFLRDEIAETKEHEERAEAWHASLERPLITDTDGDA